MGMRRIDVAAIEGRRCAATAERPRFGIPRRKDPTMSEELKTVARVDLARYLGTWYEIAQADAPSRTRPRATSPPPRARGRRRGARDQQLPLDAEGEVDVAEGRAEPVDAGNNAKLEVTFLPRGLRWIPFARGDYWILRRRGLPHRAGRRTRRKYLWLLHREPRMDPAMRGEWLEFARTLGYDRRRHLPAQSGQVHREAEARDEDHADGRSRPRRVPLRESTACRNQPACRCWRWRHAHVRRHAVGGRGLRGRRSGFLRCLVGGLARGQRQRCRWRPARTARGGCCCSWVFPLLVWARPVPRRKTASTRMNRDRAAIARATRA